MNAGLFFLIMFLAIEIPLMVRLTRKRFVDFTQIDKVDRLASWELRRGRYLASERLRHARIAQAIDARATVQPKVTPRLP